MILFAHSNFMVQDDKQMARMRPYAPLSTLIAAALLRGEGHEVALFDATFALGIDAFERMLGEVRPRVVAIMEDNFNFLTKMCTTVRRDSALAMIRLARARGCRVAVNGPDASDNPLPYFEAGAHAVILEWKCNFSVANFRFQRGLLPRLKKPPIEAGTRYFECP